MPAREPTVNGSAPSAAPDGQVIDVDWVSARSESVDVLRERAKDGSVSAAAQLVKLANVEIRTAIPCEGHVTAEAFWTFVQQVFDLYKSALLGPFARKLNHEFDVPLERVEDMVEDIAENVAREINARIESALEGLR